ncbi:hypothetical protein D3C71_2238520 [compost metagenome]
MAQALFAAGLDLEDGFDLLGRGLVAPQGALHLQGFRRIDHQNALHLAKLPGLDHQGRH